MTQSLATRTRGSHSKIIPSSEDSAALECLRQDSDGAECSSFSENHQRFDGSVPLFMMQHEIPFRHSHGPTGL